MKINDILVEGEKFRDCSHMLKSLMGELHSAIRNAKTNDDLYYFLEDIEDIYEQYSEAEVKPSNKQTYPDSM